MAASRTLTGSAGFLSLRKASLAVISDLVFCPPTTFLKMSLRLLASWLTFTLALFVASMVQPARATETDQPVSTSSTVGAELVLRALSLLGVNYKFGGNSPDNGLDCSGFVRHVFKEALDLGLPRRSVDISRAGDAISRTELRPGDLVFFNTMRRAFSHVGIYIGDGKFVHAPGRGRKVKVDNMSGRYWATRFNGARRVADPNELLNTQISLIPDDISRLLDAHEPQTLGGSAGEFELYRSRATLIRRDPEPIEFGESPQGSTESAVTSPFLH